VRALIICGEAEPRSDGAFDIRAAITELLLPSDSTTIRIDLTAFVAIERNGDRAEHTLRFCFADPNGKILTSSEIMPMPGAGVDSLIFTSPLPLRLGLWKPGRHQLVLEIDGRLAAFAPLDLNPVNAASLGLPPRQLD
jgi:hypothetical protein